MHVPPRTVVILEASLVMRGILRHLLARWGFEVVGETDSLPTAVELCRAENPSILLTTPFGANGDPEQTLVQAMARALCSTRVVVARGTTAESMEHELETILSTRPRES